MPEEKEEKKNSTPKEKEFSRSEAIDQVGLNERKKFSALIILPEEEMTLKKWKELMKKKRLIT